MGKNTKTNTPHCIQVSADGFVAISEDAVRIKKITANGPNIIHIKPMMRLSCFILNVLMEGFSVTQINSSNHYANTCYDDRVHKSNQWITGIDRS